MDSVPTDFSRITYPDGRFCFQVMVHVVMTERVIYTTFSHDRMYSYVSDCLSIGEPHRVTSFYVFVSPDFLSHVFESCKNSESKPKYTFKK